MLSYKSFSKQDNQSLLKNKTMRNFFHLNFKMHLERLTFYKNASQQNSVSQRAFCGHSSDMKHMWCYARFGTILQFKKREKHPWSITFSKVACKSINASHIHISSVSHAGKTKPRNIKRYMTKDPISVLGFSQYISV